MLWAHKETGPGWYLCNVTNHICSVSHETKHEIWFYIRMHYVISDHVHVGVCTCALIPSLPMYLSRISTTFF